VEEDGLAMMRNAGLRRLLRVFVDSGSQVEGLKILQDWQDESLRYTKRLRSQQLRFYHWRDDLYRKLCDWLAKTYDVIVWEDLGLKQMAEQDSGEYAIENAQFYRQNASLSTVRGFLQQAMAKHGRLLHPVNSAWTNRCSWCGEYLQPSSNLLVVCEKGHTNDIDQAASAYLLSQIDRPASTTNNPPQIPVELQRCLRITGGNS
jgi:hypothetical protein